MVYLKIIKSNNKLIRCELRKNPSRVGKSIPYERALELIADRKPVVEITLPDFYSATYNLGERRTAQRHFLRMGCQPKLERPLANSRQREVLQ